MVSRPTQQLVTLNIVGECKPDPEGDDVLVLVLENELLNFSGRFVVGVLVYKFT